MWKTFSVSPLFGYDKVSSPDYIQICLRQHLENQKYNEITVETVKGFAIFQDLNFRLDKILETKMLERLG